MPIPTITHMQFLALDCLAHGALLARELKDEMSDAGGDLSAPAFYQLMGRLMHIGLVNGWIERYAGPSPRRRRYAATVAGLQALQKARDFYAERARR